MRHTLYFLATLLFVSSCVQNHSENAPTDQQLIYISSRGNGFDIYRSNQDGTAEIQLTEQRGFDWGPRWWAAKQGILHYEQDTAGNFSHRLMDRQGNKMEMVFPELSDFLASPDGKFALYSKKTDEFNHIFMHNLNTGEEIDITPENAYSGRPKWSPDSQQIIFNSDRSGNAELYLYTLADQSTTQLTDGELDVKYTTWSPDGMQIAFTAWDNDKNIDHDIFLLTLKTKDIERFTSTPDIGEIEIAWSPMGDKLVYHGVKEEENDIFTIDVNTREIVKITNGEGYHGEPAWVPIYQKED